MGFAARRHGVIDTGQLAALGLGRHAISRLVASGQLHRVHRGVYAVGRPDLTPYGHHLAAVVALGPTAVLSHTSAAGLWGLLDGALHPVHVLVASKGRPARRGIRVHRTTTLHPEDTLVLDRIPVTSVDRTLLDLAAIVPRRRLLRAVEQAERLQRLDVGGLDRVLRRNRGARGQRVLREILSRYTTAPNTHSRLERRFLDFVDDHALPRPTLNGTVSGYVVDAFWPGWRLVVELDSVEFHLTRRGFQEDRIRDAALQRAGHRVLRITDERLMRAPARVLDDIRALAAFRPG